jgi:CP family cyanate transporter-like MFS transporter
MPSARRVADRTAAGATPGLALRPADWLQLALLWLGGFALRVTLLAVPPVIPQIHRQLGLDEKGVSILTGLPILLLAAGAVPGAVLIARIGSRRALVTGLVAIAAGSALRGLGPSLQLLFAATLVMGVGVAVSQPAFSTLTREWFPLRVALATAAYANGLLVGETVPASLTGPLVLPALHGSWPLSFLFWSLPVVLMAILVAILTRQAPPDPALPRRWWPDFRSPHLWLLGLVMGCASAAYFGANTFLPDFVRATGRPELKDASLTALNICQLPASILVLTVARRLVGQRWPLLVAGGLIAAGSALLALTPGIWVVAWAGLVGFAAALTLVLTLALPPLLAAAGDVPRFSAGVFLIMYSCSFAGPLLGGAAWDATGSPVTPFLALAAIGLVMSGLSLSLPVVRGTS